MEEFANIINNLTENAKASLLGADIWAYSMGQSVISAEHILLGLAWRANSTAGTFLEDAGADIAVLKDKLGVADVQPAVMSVVPATRMFDDDARVAFEEACRVASDNGLDYVGSEHLLYGILSAKGGSLATVMLQSAGVDIEMLRDELVSFINRREVTQTQKKQNASEARRVFKTKPELLIDRFGVNLTERAFQGELDPVIGRTAQIERLATILSRRTKSNPMLIGEPGVGKTAVVEALAQQIAKGNVPLNLIGAEIIQLDLASMIAGTKYRGEFEQRLKQIIDELSADRSRIGFIDEIHLLMGAGAAEGMMDAANILKPALARGQIRLIGATTYEEYRRFIQKDQALDRRFQTVEITEPSLDETVKIIKGLRRNYELHHLVELSDEVIAQAVTLADKYLTDRFMPDKAIDLIDEASALKRVRKMKSSPEFKQSMCEATQLEIDLAKALEQEDYELASELKNRLDKLEVELKKQRKKLAKQTTTRLEIADVARVIALRTGIPVQQLTKSQKKLMLGLEKNLAKHIIGQPTAVAEVAKAIRRSRSGIGDSRRPIGSFIFLGPSGVGKTELAKVLAREVFGSEDALLKIDMSEFAERHSLSRLLGAPAGYVGYDDGAKLTDAIRRRPYQVVLFDEIEKADGDVYNILLQLLEDGYLTDSRGQKVSFKNTIVILTSNLGTEQIAERNNKRSYGFGQGAELVVDSKKLAIEALDRFMPIELINRFDDVVVFNQLTTSDARQIVDLMLKDLEKRLQIKNLTLKISPSTKKMLLEKGFSDKKGARLLRRTIEEQIEDQIAEALLADKIQAGDQIKLAVKKGQLELKTYAPVK